MKYCPQCNRQYSEAWLTFCTNDGSLLREELSPPADPNWDPRIRPTTFDEPGTRFNDPSEQATQWLPQDRQAPGAWIAPDERAPMTGPWQPPAPPVVRPNVKPPPTGMATASFVCGLFALMFGLFCSFPFLGVLAVIFGIVALSQSRNMPGRPGKGFAVAGIIMGGISLAFLVLWLIWVIFALAFG